MIFTEKIIRAPMNKEPLWSNKYIKHYDVSDSDYTALSHCILTLALSDLHQLPVVLPVRSQSFPFQSDLPVSFLVFLVD